MRGSVPALCDRARMHAPADEQQAAVWQLGHLRGARQVEHRLQGGGKPGAPGQTDRLAVRPKRLRGLQQLGVGFGVENDQLRPIGLRRQRGRGGDAHGAVGLLGKQGGDKVRADGIERVGGEIRACQRHAVHKLRAIPRRAPEGGVGGGEPEPLCAADILHGRQLRAEVAAQRRVGFFVENGAPGRLGQPCDGAHARGGVLRRQVAALGVRNDDVGLTVGEQAGCQGVGEKQGRGDPMPGKLDSGVQGAGEIVCDHQKLHGLRGSGASCRASRP